MANALSRGRSAAVLPQLYFPRVTLVEALRGSEVVLFVLFHSHSRFRSPLRRRHVRRLVLSFRGLATSKDSGVNRMVNSHLSMAPGVGGRVRHQKRLPGLGILVELVDGGCQQAAEPVGP